MSHVVSLANGVIGLLSPKMDQGAHSSAVTKITFQVNHPPSRPQVDDVGVQMYLVGSLKALGSWDPSKGRRMARAFDKAHWSLTVYVPQSAEFLYQYVLKDDESNVLWESSLERKQSAASTSSSLDINDNISEQEDTTSSAAIHEKQHAEEELNAIQLPEDPVSIAMESWGNDEDEEEASRESILPAPTFNVTNQLSTLPKDQHIIKPTSTKSDWAENRMVTAARNGLMSPAMQRGVKEIGNWVSKTLTAPLQQQNEIRLQDANERIHSLLQEKEKLEEENSLLREQQEANIGCLSKERFIAEDAQRELVQEREAEQMRARRIRATLRANSARFADAREGLLSLKIDMSQMQVESMAIIKEFSKGISQLALGPTSELEELKSKLRQETSIRRQLHNQVLELKGNIRVMCRVRPLSAQEVKDGKKLAVQFSSDQDLSISMAGKNQTFSYDKVFAPDSTQDQVYEETRPLVTCALDCYNVCVFAYGQTGSGKTHTMGMMNTRALEDLFKFADDKKMIAKYDFRLSAIEIYNEQVRDLLEPLDASGKPKKLDIKTDPATGASTVPDMKHAGCSSITDVDSLMELAVKNRTSASTSMNQHSSRSHLILTVHINRVDLVNGGTLFGKLHLIDLAGSERLSRSGAEGERLTEAKSINKSLSALGNCVSALVTKSKHVPYRDSKLTFLLQDSLGMDNKTLMFVCASPADADVTETSCSFQFAARVSKVELGAAKRRGDGGAAAQVKDAEAKAKKAEDEKNQALARIEELVAERCEMVSSAEKAIGRHKAMAARETRLEEREGGLRERESKLETRERALQKSEARKERDVPRQTCQPPRKENDPREVAKDEAATVESALEETETLVTEGWEVAVNETVNGNEVGSDTEGDKENTDAKENARGGHEAAANSKESVSLEERLAMFRARKEDARKRQERLVRDTPVAPTVSGKSPLKSQAKNLCSPRVSKRISSTSGNTGNISSTSGNTGNSNVQPVKTNVTKPRPFALSKGPGRPRTAPVSQASASVQAPRTAPVSQASASVSSGWR